MKYKIKICTLNDKSSWFEEYVNDTDPDQFGKELVEAFNKTLRPGEERREYVGFEMIDKNFKEHEWEKSSAITKARNGVIFDTYKCKGCGVTGKRFGLSNVVVRDQKYKAEKYNSCHPAINT